jgi:hypothetical protein
MKAAEKIELGEAPFAKGDRVEISEEGIRPWAGTVTAVKPSFASGWWIEVLRDDGTGTWSISVVTDIRLLAKEETS